MPRLPQASGDHLAKLLVSLGYAFERQRGSHARYSRRSPGGTHHVTIPMHRVIAKGTLSDILTQVSVACGIGKEELISRL